MSLADDLKKIADQKNEMVNGTVMLLLAELRKEAMYAAKDGKYSITYDVKKSGLSNEDIFILERVLTEDGFVVAKLKDRNELVISWRIA